MFVHQVKLTRAECRGSSVNHQSPAAHLHSSVVVLQLCRIGWSLHRNKQDVFYSPKRAGACSTDYHSYVSVSRVAYLWLTLEDDLSHEVCVKHNHGQIGEPREEVAHTQPPQLPRHLSRTHRHMVSHSWSLPTLGVNANGSSWGREDFGWISGHLRDAFVLQGQIDTTLNRGLFPRAKQPPDPSCFTLSMDSHRSRTVVPPSLSPSPSEVLEERLLAERCSSRLWECGRSVERSFRLRDSVTGRWSPGLSRRLRRGCVPTRP